MDSKKFRGHTSFKDSAVLTMDSQIIVAFQCKASISNGFVVYGGLLVLRNAYFISSDTIISWK